MVGFVVFGGFHAPPSDRSNLLARDERVVGYYSRSMLYTPIGIGPGLCELLRTTPLSSWVNISEQKGPRVFVIGLLEVS